MKKIIIALSLCLALLLGLCVYLEVRQPQAQPMEPVAYRVQFTVLGKTVSSQTVTEGGLPESFSQPLPGVRFLGWVDENGSSVDPFTAAVTGDISYTGIAYPELTSHAPFLFCDEDNLLRPDEALTGKALSQALTALAAPSADAYFPAFPADDTLIDRETAILILSNFFEADAVNAAFAQDAELTRSGFAQGMCILLGRNAETVTVAESTVLPADVTADRADAAVLLEACVSHTPASGGTSWQEFPLPTAYEPGFLLLDGWLYYVDENRCFLRSGAVGTLQFGPDGRYTCGDSELDITVAGLLKTMAAENPEATRFELLRVAYDYCHQTFGYRRSWDDHPAKGSHGWEIQRAKNMFETGKGNCYGFAATFWALARGLGYEARAISGVVLADEQPHSWCFIEFDGKDYIFDPQWQFDYTRREIYQYDMFYLPTDDIFFWGYQWFE